MAGVRYGLQLQSKQNTRDDVKSGQGEAWVLSTFQIGNELKANEEFGDLLMEETGSHSCFKKSLA
jgi:hypothetical protein